MNKYQIRYEDIQINKFKKTVQEHLHRLIYNEVYLEHYVPTYVKKRKQ